MKIKAKLNQFNGKVIDRPIKSHTFSSDISDKALVRLLRDIDLIGRI